MLFWNQTVLLILKPSGNLQGGRSPTFAPMAIRQALGTQAQSWARGGGREPSPQLPIKGIPGSRGSRSQRVLGSMCVCVGGGAGGWMDKGI